MEERSDVTVAVESLTYLMARMGMLYSNRDWTKLNQAADALSGLIREGGVEGYVRLLPPAIYLLLATTRKAALDIQAESN